MPPKSKVAKLGRSYPAPSHKKSQRSLKVADDGDEEPHSREVILKQEKDDDDDEEDDNFDVYNNDDDDIFVKKRSRCDTYEPYKVIVQNQRGTNNLSSMNSHSSSAPSQPSASQPSAGSSNSCEPRSGGKIVNYTFS